MAAHPLAVLAGASALCAAVVAGAHGRPDLPAVLLGVPGPLAAALVTWRLVERAQQRAPERVSALMVKLFGAKLVFFGGYVAVAVSALPRGAVAFVVSFTSQYILLHLLEALALRRLFSGATTPRGG